MGFFDVAGVLISGWWHFFTGIEIPGLPGVTIASVMVALFLAGLGLRLVSYIFSLPGGGGGDSPRTSSTSNPRISKERRHDEF